MDDEVIKLTAISDRVVELPVTDVLPTKPGSNAFIDALVAEALGSETYYQEVSGADEVEETSDELVVYTGPELIGFEDFHGGWNDEFQAFGDDLAFEDTFNEIFAPVIDVDYEVVTSSFATYGDGFVMLG